MCGSVQVHLTEPALLTLACHCRDCQKFTASAYSLTTMFPRDGFSYEGKVVRGGLGTGDRAHYFCASCLNFIFSEVRGAEWRINLRTTVLEDAASFPPFIELMTDEKLPWASVPVIHSFARHPASAEEVQALMDSYARQ